MCFLFSLGPPTSDLCRSPFSGVEPACEGVVELKGRVVLNVRELALLAARRTFMDGADMLVKLFCVLLWYGASFVCMLWL